MPAPQRGERGERGRGRVVTRIEILRNFERVMAGWPPAARNTGQVLSAEVSAMGGIPVGRAQGMKTTYDVPTYVLVTPGDPESKINVSIRRETYQIGGIVGKLDELIGLDAEVVRSVLRLGVQHERDKAALLSRHRTGRRPR